MKKKLLTLILKSYADALRNEIYALKGELAGTSFAEESVTLGISSTSFPILGGLFDLKEKIEEHIISLTNE